MFQHFLDVFITMPIPVGGTDGYCGDADGDLEDETVRRFWQRVGELRVAQEESLFDRELTHMVLLSEDTSQASRTWNESSNVSSWEELLGSLECESGTPEDASSLCVAHLSNETSEDWLEACAIDVCVGGAEQLNHTAMLVSQSQDIVEEELQRVEQSVEEPVVVCHTCTIGENCFKDVKWAMEVGIPSGFYKEQGWMPEVDESSCFEEVQAALKAWQSLPNFDVGGMQDKAFPAPCEGAEEQELRHGLVFCR